MKSSTWIPILPAILLLAGCNRVQESAAAPEARKPETAKTNKDEITLSTAEQATANVEVKTATLASEPELLRANGRIAIADDSVWRVGVRTDGLAVEVYAGPGDYVKKGQILARYHADEVRDVRAVYRSARSELDRAKAAVAQAERNRDRAQRLLELKAGSMQQVEQTRQELSEAAAAVRKAEIEIERTKDLLEDDLRVPAEPRANDPLSDEVPIVAPAAGYVIEKNVTPGRAIQRTTDTFVIGNLSRLWMLASVRQEDLSHLRGGQSATVTLPGDDSARFPGRITDLGQRFDPETRTAQIRIEVNNTRLRLRPEMLAIAEIPIGSGQRQLSISSEAVQQVNGQDIVFVRIAPDRFAVRPVRVGETVGGRTPVLEGLAVGEAVVTRGSFILKSRLLKASLDSE